MTVPLLLIGLILFGVWACICYFIIKFISSFIIKLTRPTTTINKTVVVIFSIFIAGLSSFYLLFTTPAKNYKTAYVERQGNSYKVTLKGKRVLMTHDLTSVFLRKTYEDSISLILPRQNGIIKSTEILISQNRSKSIGTITVDNLKMTIRLFYDDKQREPDGWNGKYNLIER